MRLSRVRPLIALSVTAMLAACGGAGTTTPLVDSPMTSPSAGGGTLSFLNTTNPYYLPLAPGNTWRFTGGVTFIDLGPTSSLSCDPGDSYERVGMYTGGQTSTPNASFYFVPGFAIMTGTQVTGHVGARLVAISTDSSNNAVVCAFGQGAPAYLSVPTETSTVGEIFSSSGVSSPPETATITSVGGTQSIQGGSVNHVDGETVAGLGNTFGGTFSWKFAQGVGFTEFKDNTLDVTLQSFQLTASCQQQQ